MTLKNIQSTEDQPQNKICNVAILIGSLRKDSLSRKMGIALTGLAPKMLRFETVDIGSLPLYNEDLDTDTPATEFIEFRKKIKSAEAVLFITPEYNRSVPGVLKNAIDVGSAPHNQNAFAGKPGAIVSISPGAMGAFGANHHLRQSLVFLNIPTMQQPEAYIGGSEALFDAEGKITKELTREYLRKFMYAFANWIQKYAG